MPKNEPAINRVIDVLADAAISGAATAAKHHNVCLRTVHRWKTVYGSVPEIADAVQKRRAIVVDNFLVQSSKLREELMDKVLDLARESNNLHAVAQALKIVHDAYLSEAIIRPKKHTEVGPDHTNDDHDHEPSSEDKKLAWELIKDNGGFGGKRTSTAGQSKEGPGIHTAVKILSSSS